MQLVSYATHPPGVCLSCRGNTAPLVEFPNPAIGLVPGRDQWGYLCSRCLRDAAELAGLGSVTVAELEQVRQEARSAAAETAQVREELQAAVDRAAVERALREDVELERDSANQNLILLTSRVQEQAGELREARAALVIRGDQPAPAAPRKPRRARAHDQGGQR